MVGIKLLWTGVTIIMALNGYIRHADIVGGILMGIGLVLLWLDK